MYLPPLRIADGLIAALTTDPFAMTDPTYLQRLRLHAEQALDRVDLTPGSVAQLSPDDAAHLLHELNVYRTELELQNQELLISQSNAALAGERYRTLFESLPIPALVVGKNSLIHNDNDQARTLLGTHPPGHTNDYRLSRALQQPDRLRVQEAIILARRDAPVTCSDLTLVTTNGATLTMDLHCVALPEDQYQAPYYLLLLLDQTAERMRKDIEIRMASVFRHATEAIIVTDADTRIQHVNPAFEQMSGRPQAAIRGLKASVLKSDRHSPKFYADLWSTLTATGQWQGEFTNRHSDDTYYNVWATITALKDPLGNTTGYMSVQTDITQLQRAQTSIYQLTSFDALTKLPNRVLVRDRMAQQLAQATRSRKPFSVIFLDLDHFKEVNDTQGHAVGDRLLQRVASRLQGSVRAQDTVGRIGGDEFVVLLPDTPKDAAGSVAANVLGNLSAPLQLPGLQGYVTQVSLGVASWPEDGKDIDMLMRNADMAMYAAKLSGRNRVVAFDPQMGDKAKEDFNLQQDLVKALERGELRAYFQPIFWTSERTVCGAEALVRWQHPERGLIPPGEFLPVAAKSGLLRQIDRWILDTVLQQLLEWQSKHQWPPGWCMSINQTAQDIRDPAWIGFLKKKITPSLQQADCLVIELSEGSWMEPANEILDLLTELNTLGVRLAIDDFGTGYSSLAYLKHLPVSTLKIDQSFVRDIQRDESDRAMVDAVVAIARKLGFKLVAEGVETDEQCTLLADMGCEYGQGFLVGPAISAEAFAAAHLTGHHGSQT